MTISTCDKNPCCGVPHDCEMERETSDAIGYDAAMASDCIEAVKKQLRETRDGAMREREDRIRSDGAWADRMANAVALAS